MHNNNIYSPHRVAECIKTLRTSEDPQEVESAWVWLEYIYGRCSAMELLNEYDENELVNNIH